MGPPHAPEKVYILYYSTYIHIFKYIQVGVRPAAARLALGVEMEGWKLNKARGPCLLALELGPTHHQLALDSAVRDP